MARVEQEAEPGTRGRIIEAALETLKSEGYAGTSARAIARRGGFNQALIFYHFGSVNGLLLAALDHTSAIRMRRYRAAVEEAHSLEDMLDVALRIYGEDLEAGHMTVLSEMVAGSMAHPELKPEISARLEPWIGFTEGAIKKALTGSPLRPALPSRELAFGLVAFYCGVNMLVNLERDRKEIDRLFRTARRMAPLISRVLRIRRSRRRRS
jgi:AcrR family transcriptional regulator